MKKLLIVLLSVFLFKAANAQNDNATLFTVSGKPVSASEFKYIYNKTNGDKADFSQKSLEDYLDLYIKFKRKVARAREMQLDTIPALQSELAGYRQQLANSYLVDKEVTEQLVKEAHSRMQKDIEVAHILVKLDKNASAKDTLEAYKKALDIKARIDKGDFFENVARTTSDDPSAKDNGGSLGYITALLPTGFYELENAIYNTPIGKVSMPVRSDMGYHLIKVLNSRPARGEIEAAHILIRTKEDGSNNAAAKSKIDSIYTLLSQGSVFGALAQQLSEDKANAAREGYVGFFGIGRYEPAFEDGAFSIKEDGAYSKPFKTSVGWHIIKRISVKPVPGFEAEKRRLKAKIQRDSRYEVANRVLVNRIKTEVGFKENTPNLDKYTKMQGDSFVTYKWRMPVEKSPEVLFSFKDKNFSVGDFNDYINNNSRKRLSYQDNPNIEEAVRVLYADFVKESCIKHEEGQLETKHPEFKSLMREYEEGILLFEAMKREVWDKASQDSVGLYAFHQTQKDKYKWDERVDVNLYSLKGEAKEKIEDLRSLAAKKTYDKVLKKMNKKGEIVTVEPFKYEKGKNKTIDAIAPWVVGKLTPTEENKRNNTFSFNKIEKITAPTTKTLAEARGYVVADYQEFLEKKWLNDLERGYEVQVNKDVLAGMVKK